LVVLFLLFALWLHRRRTHEPVRDHSSGIVATNATASLAASHERSVDFVKALWDLPPPSGQYRYYDGMPYFMALLHASGELKAYGPK
jgi:oligosaccharide reducing-end xylanase